MIIIPINKCRTAFQNASAAFTIDFKRLTMDYHTMWVETYGVAPMLETGGTRWESLQFKSEQDYIMFLLKWS